MSLVIVRWKTTLCCKFTRSALHYQGSKQNGDDEEKRNRGTTRIVRHYHVNISSTISRMSGSEVLIEYYCTNFSVHITKREVVLLY